jgi:hypothetical protein
MPRARRTDRNHREVLDELRQVGAAVKDTHELAGCLDALVGFRGRLYWLEIKDGAKSASRRKLTPAEQEVFMQFEAVGCPPIVVTSADDALKAIGAV